MIRHSASALNRSSHPHSNTQNEMNTKWIKLKSFSKDDKSVANNFNKFFTTVGSNTVMKIKSLAKENNYTPSKLPSVPTSYTESDQFTFEPVECSLVENIAKSMPDNKAPGIDKVPIRIIKDCLPVIAPWITSIINQSLVIYFWLKLEIQKWTQ